MLVFAPCSYLGKVALPIVSQRKGAGLMMEVQEPREWVEAPPTLSFELSDEILREDAGRALAFLRDRIVAFEATSLPSPRITDPATEPGGRPQRNGRPVVIETTPGGLPRRRRGRPSAKLPPTHAAVAERPDANVAATASAVVEQRARRVRDERAQAEQPLPIAYSKLRLEGTVSPTLDDASAPFDEGPKQAPSTPSNLHEEKLATDDSGGEDLTARGVPVAVGSLAIEDDEIANDSRIESPWIENEVGRWGAKRTGRRIELENHATPLLVDDATGMATVTTPTVTTPTVADRDVAVLATVITEAMVEVLARPGGSLTRPEPPRRSFWADIWHADVLLWIAAMVLVAVVLIAFAV